MYGLVRIPEFHSRRMPQHGGGEVVPESAQNQLTVAAPMSGSRRTGVRFFVLALISTGVVINYLDRTILGIAAPLLSRDLHLGAAGLGLLFSAFSWTYAAAQVPGGVLLDRFGTRIVYGLAVGFWSLFTLLQGTIASFAALLGCRLGLGVAEAPCYPANSRVLGAWFPQAERARATGVFSLGQYFGLAFLSPLLFWIAARFGWRALFLLAGVVGLAFATLWLLVYRDPDRSARVNRAELEHIREGGGLVRSPTAVPWSWRTMGRLLAHRDFLGAALGQFASNSTLVFFLTWFPTYLASAHHLRYRTAGFLAALPYIAASVGVLFGGWWSDWLIKRTGSPTIGRKAPIVTGLCMASTLVAANFVHSDALVIGILSFVFFGQGMCNLGWTLITDLSPPALRGLTTGTFNLFANIAGVVTPLVIGVLVGSTHSFIDGLAFVSAVALLGVLCYLVLLGPVRQIELAHIDC
jgi:ACS family D-galactonate transporter-like MFS transporter